MGLNLFTVPVLTDGSGNASASAGPITGAVYQVRYVPDGAAPLDTGADLTISGEITGVVVADHDNIGTSAFTKSYTLPASQMDGTELTEDGSHIRYHPIFAGEDVSVVIANGGSAKRGTFYLWVYG